jgi:uncharacterized membrane protein
MNYSLDAASCSREVPRKSLDSRIELGATVGRCSVAVAMLAFGVQHLVYGDFVTRLVPGLVKFPARAALACAFGIYLVGSGMALLFKPIARWTALILGGTIFSSFAFLYLPLAFASLTNMGLWTNAGKALALSGSAFLVAGTLPGERPGALDRGRFLFEPLERLIPISPYFLGAFLAFCGVLHFFFVGFVASLVPAWIPGTIFWSYFSGVALVAGGLGIILPGTRRLAALCSSFMIFSWVVLLHIPRAVANLRDSNETTAVFEAIAIAGAAWMAASPAVRPRSFYGDSSKI